MWFSQQRAGQRVRQHVFGMLAVLALVALFLMHGPSSDHTMLMPVASSGHEMITVHELPDVTSMPPAGGKQDSAATDRGAGSGAMSHSDCLATLRDDGSGSTPEVTLTMRVGPPSVGVGTRSLVDPARANTSRPPDLERLCISRT